jgi:polysaccharide biosynthesis protein PslH
MKRKILVISQTPTHPPNAGNRSRIKNILDSLIEWGHEVHFLHLKKDSEDDSLMRSFWQEKFYSYPYKTPPIKFSKTWKAIKKIKAYFGKEHFYVYSIDDWYDDSTDDFIKELQIKEQFDTVIIVYVFLTKALENFGKNVLKILDAQDIFTNRHKLYLKQGQKPKFFFTSAKEEAKGLNRADIIIAIQPEEAKFYRKQVNKKVIALGHLVSLAKPVSNQKIEPKLLFVGSSNPINIHGLNYFLKEIFPLVRSRNPTIELLIAGNICDVIEDCQGCIKLGAIEELEQAYQMSDIVINPVLFGTGLKIKSVEALGYGKALVTTSAGAVGLDEGKNDAFLVADKPAEFCDRILDILNNPDFFNRLAQKAYQYAVRLNQNNLNSLQKILEQ